MGLIIVAGKCIQIFKYEKMSEKPNNGIAEIFFEEVLEKRILKRLFCINDTVRTLNLPQKVDFFSLWNVDAGVSKSEKTERFATLNFLRLEEPPI